MSFEVYNCSRTCLIMGQAAIDTAGNVTFNAVDLQTAGIREAVCIMIDRDLKRIAVRKPTSSDPAKKVTFNKSKNAAKVNCVGAIKIMGLTPAKAAGKHAVMHKDNLLIINLA